MNDENNLPKLSSDKIEDKAIKIASLFLSDIVDSPKRELGYLLGDIVGSWRFNNKVRLLLKTKNYLKENGIDYKKVLPDIFVPLVEEGGNTEDEMLSNMFASLLACHLDPYSESEVHPGYSKTLSMLSSFDARVLEYLYSSILKVESAIEKEFQSVGNQKEEFTKAISYSKRNAAKYITITQKELIEKFKINDNVSEMSTDNLVRLGILIRQEEIKEKTPLIREDLRESEEDTITKEETNSMWFNIDELSSLPFNLRKRILAYKRDEHFVECYKLSLFGYNFIKACKRL